MKIVIFHTDQCSIDMDIVNKMITICFFAPVRKSNLIKSMPSYQPSFFTTESVRMGEEFKSKLELTENTVMNRATISYYQLPT